MGSGYKSIHFSGSTVFLRSILFIKKVNFNGLLFLGKICVESVTFNLPSLFFNFIVHMMNLLQVQERKFCSKRCGGTGFLQIEFKYFYIKILLTADF